MGNGSMYNPGRRGLATTVWGAALLTLAAVALALAAAPAAAAGATLSVAVGGSDSGDCVTSPCATIQYAVDQAGAGDTVEVGPGTYEEEVTVRKEVALRGANAGVPAGGTRGAETTIAAGPGGTKALTAGGPGITVDGFTITSDAAYALFTEGATGLRVADDILQSGARALTMTGGSAGATIEGSRIEGGLYAVVLAGPDPYSNLLIADNAIAGTSGGNYALFNPGDASFPGLRVQGNRIQGSSNIGGNVEGGTITGNTFTADPGGLALQVDLHGSSVSGNRFEGGGAGSCLQLFGSQLGLDPSDGAAVTGNDFHGCAPYGIQLSPDIDNVAITANTITDSYDGIDTRLLENEAPWDLAGRAIRVSGNRIVGSAHLGIDNRVEGTIDAADNWWGCNAGPTGAGGNGCDPVSAGVQAAPWLVLTSSAPAMVGTGASATVTAAIDTDSSGAHVATVPDGTPVTYSTDRGSLDPAATTTVGGVATTTLASPTHGLATVTATVDGQTVSSAIGIGEATPPPPPPATTPPGKPTPPKVEVAGEGGAPVRVSPAGIVTVATVACPQGSCRIAIKQRKVKVGKRGFPLTLKLDKLIGEGESTAVTAVLLARARHALGSKGKGQAIVRLRLFSGAGTQEIPLHVRLAAPRRAR